MALIGINGYANSGKDAVGIIIQYLNCTNVGNLTIEDVIEDYEAHQWWLEEQSEWEIKKYAGKLKDIASHLTGIPIEDFEDQEFKKQNLGPQWTIHGMPMTVRQFLQRLGTDALRDGLHTNVWVNALMSEYEPEHYLIGALDTELTDDRFYLPPTVYIDGLLLTYEVRSDRRYVSREDKTITINNGGVNEGENIQIFY